MWDAFSVIWMGFLFIWIGFDSGRKYQRNVERRAGLVLGILFDAEQVFLQTSLKSKGVCFTGYKSAQKYLIKEKFVTFEMIGKERYLLLTEKGRIYYRALCAIKENERKDFN